MYATSAAVTFTAKPGIGAMPLNPIFRSTATTPKHTADISGRRSATARTPVPRPPAESRVVPPTMTSVPTRTGAVTCSPRTAMASAEATRGLRLMSAALIDAPTVSMLMKRSRRPPTVPMRPASAKYATPAGVGRPTPPPRSTAIHTHVVPTTRFTQAPV